MVEHSKLYITFNYACVAVALVMLALSLWLIDEPLATKGYLGMGILFLVGSLVTLTKTVRDVADAEKHLSRLDKAKTEKLLTEYSDIES